METTRNLTLPSGATCRVRRLTARDSLGLGFFPDTLGEDVAESVKTAKRQAAEREHAVKMNEIILCACLSPVTGPDGNVFKVVSKGAWDCSDSEQNCDLFATTDDGAAVVTAVLELSGFTQAAKEAAKPFPEEPGVDGVPGQPLHSVPQASQ